MSVPVQQPAITVRNVSKSFGATKALTSVSFDVVPGSIHALIGLNGSGKSTIVKALSGFHQPDEGEIEMGDVVFVHQDLGLLPPLTVLENFAIGRPMMMRRGQIDWRAEEKLARRALDEFGLGHTVHRPVSSLSMAQQAILAIARALSRSTEGRTAALVLDEPTSALPHHETDLLAGAMRAYAEKGLGILFITHRLQEVKDLADTVTALRNGAVVSTRPTADLTIQDMVHSMVGDAPIHVQDGWAPKPHGAAPVLTCHDLRGDTLDGVSLQLFDGEIVGVFGMTGSGIEQIGVFLSGRGSPRSGTVTVEGRTLTPQGDHMSRIGYVPSDRARRGVLAGLSVRENLSLRSLPRTLRRGSISAKVEGELASKWVQDLRIKTHSTEIPIGTLSGGNQQKAVLGRWLAIEPTVIIAEEPTQGIDVWAKTEILRRLREAASKGAGVLLTAVEPEEILDFCDRVLVLRHGKITLDARRGDIRITDILSAMH